MAYTFTPDLETGNALIDTEHKELIGTINDLLVACGQGKGRDSLAKTTQFLQTYTAKHFADEEALQKQSGYPDYANHKKYHDGFKAVVADLMRKLNEQGPTIVLVGEVNTAVAGWLLNHIRQEDKKVAAHLKKKQ